MRRPAGAGLSWRRARLLPASIALAAIALALTGARAEAQRAADTKTVPVSGKVVVEAQGDPGPNDPKRCIAVTFLRFSDVPGAISYSAVLNNVAVGRQSFGGPPFDDDYKIKAYSILSFPAPGGHQLALGSYSTGSGCADAKATAEGRMTLISLTATVKAGTPPTPPPKEKTPSLKVALSLVGAPTLLTPGDTPDVKVTVSAGEEAVHNVKFSGNALRTTGSAVEITGGPIAPASFSLAPGGSRSFSYKTKATATGTSSLRSAVTGVGPKGEALSDSAGIDVKVQKSALAFVLTTKPSQIALELDDEAKVAPRTVSVEVKLKNTTGAAIERISLVGLFPQPVDPTAPGDQLAFDKKLLPVKVGTLRPGATFTRTFPLTVTSDGGYRIRALATYAESATKPTQTAAGLGGGFEATVPPLYFEAKVEKPVKLVQAGKTVLITGKVKNVSAVKTLCLAPVLPKRSGNAGGTGPADLAVYGPDEIAPPIAGKLGPGKDILFGLWVKTVVDGSPRGTIKLDPKAGTLEEGSDCLATAGLQQPLKPDQIHIVPGSTDFTIHVDVRDPQFSATVGEVAVEFFGGLTAGAAKGSYDFFSSTCASVLELLSPANLIKTALDPLGVYRGFAQAIKSAETIGHYWETASPEEKKHYYSQIWSVLSRASGDTWAPVRAKIDSIVDPWMTNVANASARGDYKTVAGALGDLGGNVTTQVVLNVATAELANEVFARASTLAKAFEETGGLSKTYKTLRELPPGKLLNLRELRNLFGVAARDLKEIGAVAEEFGVRIGVKGRSAESIAELDKGSVWKPEPVKPKTVNDIDRKWLGFKSRRGIVSTKRFAPEEVSRIRARIANANLSFEEKQAIIERLGVRLGEEKYLPELQQMAARKRIDVGKNYRDNGFSPEDAPSTQEIRAFSLAKTAGPLGSTEYIPKMWNPNKGFLANITGDIDGLYIVNFAGGPLSLEKKLKILQRLWEIGWQHPETLTWIKNGEVAFASKSEILGAHALGGEAALEIGPDGIARAVFLNLEQSFFFGAQGFWLDVVGGFVAR